MLNRPLVFVHSSDELYGADRVLMEMLAALPAHVSAEVWLPTDQSQHLLCTELRRRGVAYRHVELPIMRRAYRNPRAMFGLVARCARLVLAFRRARPAAVYCTTSAAFLAVPAARAAGVRHVLGHIQEVWSDQDRRVLARLAGGCHVLLAVSASAAAGVGDRLKRKIVVVQNSSPDPARRSALSGRRGGLTFVIASRWTPGKGYGTLLTAWDQLSDPGRLVILGGPPPTGNAVDVPALVSGLRRPDTVEVVGEVSDPTDYLDEADVVLVPSDYPEGFGLVAIEAFAHGRPVVASSAGGLVDIVEPGRNGWLFPARDADGLAHILATLNRVDVTTGGAHARELYERRYTAAAYAARWAPVVTAQLSIQPANHATDGRNI